jgi:hypothetical protein
MNVTMPLNWTRSGLTKGNATTLQNLKSPEDPGGQGTHSLRQPAHARGKVVSPKNRPPFTHRNYSWYSLV